MAREWEPGMRKNRKGVTSGSGETSPYVRGSATSSGNWADCESSAVTALLGAVVQRGDAALFGASRDGAVLVLTVCSGDERIKYYARTTEEMNKHISDILVALDGRAGRS